MDSYLDVVTDDEIAQVMGGAKDSTIVQELCQMYELHKSESGGGIPLTAYHNLLANGEMERVKGILQSLPSQEIKDYVLNSLIKYDNLEVGGKHVEWAIKQGLRLPLALATYSGNQELVQLLLNQGTKVTTSCEHGNILHSFVQLHDRFPKTILSLYELLTSVISSEEMGEILSACDQKGATPLDLAIKTSAYPMIDAFLRTDGVHRFVGQQIGVHLQVSYKIPARNTIINGKCSIVDSVCNASEQELPEIEDRGLLSREPLKTLLELQKKSYNVDILKMMLLQVVTGSAFLVQLFWFLGGFQLVPAISIIGLTLTAVCIVCELMFLKDQWRNIWLFFTRWWVKRTPIVIVFPVRLCFYAFLFFFATSCYEELFTEIDISRHLVTQSQAIFYLVISLLFYFQYFTRMAALMLICIHMVKDVIIFMTLNAGIFLAYALVFWIIHYPVSSITGSSNSTLTNSTSNSTTVCKSSMFDGFVHSIYETFLLGLTITPPESLYFQGSHNSLTATTLYVGCITVWSILLLNLLIALFNERLTEVTRYGATLSQLLELGMVLHVETYTGANGWLFTPIAWLKSCRAKVGEDHVSIEVMEEIGSGACGRVVNAADL